MNRKNSKSCRVFVLTGTERLKSKVTCHTGRYWYCLFINRWETGLMSRFDNFSQWKRHLHFHSRQKISIPQTEKIFSVCFSKIFPTDRNLIINFNFFNWLLLLYYLPHLKIFWITHKYSWAHQENLELLYLYTPKSWLTGSQDQAVGPINHWFN